MSFRKTLAVVAVASLAVTPVAAQTMATSKSVVASKAKRAGPSQLAESKFGGKNGVLVALAAAAAVALGIVVLSGDDKPTSP
jgi:hypothetical protein